MTTSRSTTETHGLCIVRPYLHFSPSPETFDHQVISELQSSHSASKIRTMHGGHDSSPRGKSEEKERYTNEELITELRIRIAVLENELKHAKSQRDEAVDSSVLITKTLISALDRGDKENQIRKTESELKELSLENVALREGK